MATQIRNYASSSSSTSAAAGGGGGGGVAAKKAKADLIYRMDDFADNVNGAVIIAREDGVITVSDDR